MVNFFKQSKKSFHFEIEVLTRLDLSQVYEARLGDDIRQIVREEINNILIERNKKGWWQVA